MYTLSDLAEMLDVEARGQLDAPLSGVATLDKAKVTDVSFIANVSYLPQLAETKAGCVVVAPEHLDQCPGSTLIAENPKLVFSRIMQIFYPPANRKPGIDPSATVSASATVPSSCTIGPNVVIGDEAILGESVVVLANAVISERCVIGDKTCLCANVTLYPYVHVGRDCLVHSGAVIGSDGFGFANENGKWVKMPQVGSVIVGDQVEIGANTCIDAGALDPTRIGNGVILDNLIQIGHNVEIGDYTAIAANVAIAGSAKLGRYCLVGGSSSINGHIQITDHVHMTGGCNVKDSIAQAGVYSSAHTALPAAQWRRVHARHNKLDDFAKKVRALERRFEMLQNNAS